MTKKHAHQDPASEVDTPEIDLMEDVSAEAQEDIDHKELWQRALAELENLRKREATERQNHAKYALQAFLEDLLPVVDNFYRATEHVPSELQNSAWVNGILYIQKNLLDVMSQRGVVPIEAKPGDPFDPTRHEAIGTVEGDQPEETIASVVAQGYMLHDRVLRPTQVTVNK